MAAWKKFSSRDAAVIEGCFTDDAVWIVPERNATALALGAGETRRMNRRQIADFLARDFGRIFIGGVNIEVTGLYGDGDTVIMEHRFRAKLANGRSYENEYCFVFKVREGRIAEMREYMDTLGGFRQIFGEEAIGVVSPMVADSQAQPA